jgi:hypothetical protein
MIKMVPIKNTGTDKTTKFFFAVTVFSNFFFFAVIVYGKPFHCIFELFFSIENKRGDVYLSPAPPLYQFLQELDNAIL